MSYFVKQKKLFGVNGYTIFFSVSSWGVCFLLEGAEYIIYTTTYWSYSLEKHMLFLEMLEYIRGIDFRDLL